MRSPAVLQITELRSRYSNAKLGNAKPFTSFAFPAEKVKAIAVAADVSKDDQVAKAVAEVVKHFGTIDILVNAAGVQIYPPKNIVELEPGEWISWSTFV